MKTARLWILLPVFCIAMNQGAIKSQPLYTSIDSLARTKNLTLGISAYQDGKYFGYNDTLQFPLMSVFKLHVCLAAVHKMNLENVTELDSILIKRNRLLQNTYSPLLENTPDSEFTVSYFDLICYTLALSDNNTCDILTEYCGGIRNVYNFIRTLGITDFNLQETEATMHKDITKSYNNRATPQSVNELLQKTNHITTVPTPHNSVFRNSLADCQTGADKIKAGLPQNLNIWHKTGSAPAINGNIIADNDAAIIQTHNKEWLYLCIFIKDSKETAKTDAEVISQAANIIYNHFNQ